MTIEMETTMPHDLSDGRNEESAIAAAARARLRARKILVHSTQIAILVLGLGIWEIGSRTGLIDPFFFGSPFGIVLRLAD
jgi:NitT/TauT family transport system permease protein